MVEHGAKLLAREGCLNFFAGPATSDFEATVNFYDVHSSGHHFVATTGGTYADVAEALPEEWVRLDESNALPTASARRRRWPEARY